MNVVYKGIGYLRQWYSQVNPATLTGAIDILVVEQPDGTLVASPFHVRFGKLGVLRAKEKMVNIAINDEKIVNLHMKLGDQGEAFFVEECDDENAVPVSLITSPLPSRPSTPTENGASDDKLDEEVCASMVSMEEVGKRKRRKKRKRRSIISSSTTSASDDTRTVGGSSSSEIEDEPVQMSSAVEVQDSSGKKSTTERSMSVDSTESYHDGENRSFSSMRCVLSDSELPGMDSKAMPMNLSPFSDSEATETRQPSDVMWGWGQLPGRNKQDSESSSEDAGALETPNFTEEIDGAMLVEPDFRTIPTSDSVRVEDETEALHKKERTISSTSHSSSASRKRCDTEGLYLDDVLSLEPSEANIYLQKSSRAAAGPVTQSSTPNADAAEPPPNPSPERAASPAAGSDIDSGTDCQTNEDTSYRLPDQQDDTDLAISLCGFVSGSNDVDKDKFVEKQVDYEAFLRNPLSIVNDPNLVVRLGTSRFLNWQAAVPLMVSLAAFKQPLTQECLERVVQSAQPQPQTNRLMGWLWRRPSRLDQQNAVNGKAPASPGKESKQSNPDHCSPLGKSHSVVPSSESEVADIITDELQRSHSAHDLMSTSHDDHALTDLPPSSSHSNFKTMRKSTRLTSEKLTRLNLQPGANTITFSVTTKYQGTTRCSAHVFLWKWSDKLVVSDIDGTITKSDVMGQILPVVGKDWTQGGVAQLYQNISNNGYKFIYVSSRAIGQASMTKGYLNWINQQGVCLPPGPLLLSPTSLMIAFRREVIEKKPEKFKIECLKDIKALFPENPFVAGFGNKSNDVMAYSAVGVPSNRMFTINHRGELKHEKLPTYTTSYTGLGELVDNFFPLLDKEEDFSRVHEYSDFTYWRQDLEAFADQFSQFDLA